MNIIGVKNNLVKFIYEEDIKISTLVAIKDVSKSYIAQVIHLEATRAGKTAIAKLIFNYDGQIRNYDGSIPSLKSDIAILDSTFILDSIDTSNPLVIGKLNNNNFEVNFDILKDNPIILSEKFYVTRVLLNNIAMQIQARKQKLVVFDTAGIFKNNKLTLGKDFKLPLDSSSINYIYEKIFADATPESKAMIQSVFEELGEYAKTVNYIPFDSFKSVIDSEFARTKLIQLIILKNKIKEIQDWKVFAQTDDDITSLLSKLVSDNTIVIDISKQTQSIQQECIKHVYSFMKELGLEFYSFVNLSGDDTKIIKEISEVENVHTTVICDYDYANLSELKKASKNMFMFTPLKQQNDYGTYNTFLQKLSEDEFIAYGKMTKFIPIITKLAQITSADIKTPIIEEPVVEAVPETIEEVKEENISEPIPEDNEPVEPEAVEQEEVITEADTETQEAPQEEIPTEQEEIIPSSETEDETSAVIEEAVTQEIEEEPVGEVETLEAETIEEISAPEVETEVLTAEEQISQLAGATAQEVEPQQEEVITEDVVQEAAPVEETVTEQEAPVNEAVAALNEAPDIEDDEELSDDDLDMIEQLSKPDEEIPAISEAPTEPAPEPATEPEVIEEQTETTETTEETAEEAVEPEQQETPETDVNETPDEQEEVVNEPPKQAEPLQTRANSTPVVPEYSADFPEEDKVNSDALQQGDKVFHDEFGEGVVEKMINYGDKLLCSVNFANVGRRLLNPEISEMRRI